MFSNYSIINFYNTGLVKIRWLKTQFAELLDMTQTLDPKFEVRPTAAFSIVTLKSAKKAVSPDADIKKMKAFVLADNVSHFKLFFVYRCIKRE